MKSQSAKRVSFGRIPEIVEAPDLLNVQLESWENFLQTGAQPSRRRNKGLQAVFKMNFPVTDARENFLLEFVEYYVEKPKYSGQRDAVLAHRDAVQGKLAAIQAAVAETIKTAQAMAGEIARIQREATRIIDERSQAMAQASTGN